MVCDIIKYGPNSNKNRVTLFRPRDNSQTNHPMPILKSIFPFLLDAFALVFIGYTPFILLGFY